MVKTALRHGWAKKHGRMRRPVALGRSNARRGGYKVPKRQGRSRRRA